MLGLKCWETNYKALSNQLYIVSTSHTNERAMDKLQKENQVTRMSFFDIQYSFTKTDETREVYKL